MQIDKEQVVQLLRDRGEDARADQAASELPDQVDLDKHAGVLEKLGVDPSHLTGALGGLGGPLGEIGGKLGL